MHVLWSNEREVLNARRRHGLGRFRSSKLGLRRDRSSNVFTLVVEELGLPALEVLDERFGVNRRLRLILDAVVAGEWFAVEFVVVQEEQRDTLEESGAGREEAPGVEMLAIAASLALFGPSEDVVFLPFLTD
jgi:hypothetical protein